MLFGEQARNWEIAILGADYPGFLLAVLPPGAFLGLGLLIALKNDIDRRLAARAKVREPVTDAESAAEAAAS